jgi:signal transduction histidine kinase
MVGWCLLMAGSLLILPPGIYMAVFYFTIVSWVLLGLLVGIYRLWLGYKPARYFVAGFTVLFFGYMVSVLPMFGKDLVIRNHNLITLLAQMLDMLLLSLALADRINVLRSDKDSAFEKAFDSERLAIEKEQSANEKLQQALALSEQENQRKSDFLRMVSHELRTPLHSILSSAEQWEQVDDETVRRDLVNHITYGAARLRTQVDNLVLLAETDDHKIEASHTDFDIQPLIDRLNEIAQSLVHDNVRYTLKLDPDLPKTFRGDAYLLEHMVRTVLENACQYTREGSVEFRIEWDQGDSSLSIHVSDTGCGMTREQEQSMFNDFVQVSRGLNRKSEGLGLGLTICYRLCEVLGADFVMRSDLGQGTEVHLRVPIERVERFGGLAPEDTPLGRVLVVEDNAVNAKVMERMILYLGYDVDLADSGQQALALLERHHYHVILMDIQMPVMDGITATRWIRQRRIDTPVIAVTANSDSRVRNRCFDVGMNDVMVKPVRRSDIRRLLEQHISYRLNKS